ncbi:hypothetical protein AZI86_01420 [Bdellovibrio bacteriovorus]|uniref:Uncharacterized protein n=1 Tax=Bdellovibrio bacteriovorus TaxID=959 RepID=A0A150WN13_BDEBC|nr:hypothetical protein [Bdellovibrio bacteriovorus]KYG65764.1 hypothetical protein AZI86_01420 [Bdellovibrio bacteriovorus]
MFNTQEFKEKIKTMAGTMKSSGRGDLPADIEFKIISELEAIFLKMSEKFARPEPTVHGLVGKAAMTDLVERMECDFSMKLAKDIQHDVHRNVEIGKIKIAFLDGVRRALMSLQV